MEVIWIDITEIKNWQGHHTGIQRVIAKISEPLLEDNNFATCYFDYSTSSFRRCSYSFDEVTYEPAQPALLKKIEFVSKLSRKLKSNVPHRLRRWAKAVNRRLTLSSVRDEPVLFHDKDVLLIPGAFWIYPLDTLKKIKDSKSIFIVGIMYDLVPLIVPQFTAQVTIAGFGERFEDALSVFDNWLAISQNTKNDVLTEARARNKHVHSSSIKVIKLGVDEGGVDRATIRPAGFELQSGEFALVVGTLEARKNQYLVYQAIKRLHESKHASLPIVLVGKHGWLNDDFIYILRNDATIHDQIIWLNQVDDRGLRWLYKNCAFTIYPSFYEGWGLPIAESLNYKKPCIASNTSSMPEVGGSLVEYFSPFSPDELANLMTKYSDKGYLKSRAYLLESFVPHTWQECAQTVREVLLGLGVEQ